MERNQPRFRFRLAGTTMMVTSAAMTRLDRFLAYSESHRLTVCVTAALWISLIAWWDSLLPDVSIGFLYLFPVLFSAAALNNPQILAVALLCGFLRKIFDPFGSAPGAAERFGGGGGQLRDDRFLRERAQPEAAPSGRNIWPNGSSRSASARRPSSRCGS